MFTKNRKALVLKTAIALLTLSVGCSELPEYYGPLCDQAATGEWAPASHWTKLDKAELYRWPDDPEFEQQLRTYGIMDDSWEFLSGNDINEEGYVVSPYGKMLNTLELIVTTPELQPYLQNLAQSYPIHGSCGEQAPGIVAATWSGKSGHRIDVYVRFYDLGVVARAGFLIHEAAHAIGCPGHIDDMDQSWDDVGAYRQQVEFVATLYHAEGISRDLQDAAEEEFNYFAYNKFVEPIDISIEDFRPEGR